MVMSLSPEIRNLIIQSMNGQLTAHIDISGNEQKLKQFTNMYGYDGDVYGFVHGFLLGSVMASAYTIAKTALLRDLSEEEKKEIAELIKTMKIKILEIMTKIQNT